jgi:hypothetical protein
MELLHEPKCQAGPKPEAKEACDEEVKNKMGSAWKTGFAGRK